MTITTGLNIDLFLLVFLRVTGMMLFNPIFGRTSVPNILKVAFSLLVAFIMVPTLHGVQVQMDGPVNFIVAGLLEFSIGFGIGVLVNMIFSVVALAGEYIDMQLGLSMAQIYDPSSGISMPVIGSFYNLILLLVFLAGNAHLSLFAMLADSFHVVPPGAAAITPGAAQFVVRMGGDMLEMGLRMAIPVIAVELICVVAIGLIMRAVPSINIFAFGIQIQSIVGIVVLLVAVPVTVSMCSGLVALLLEKVAEFIRLL
ncbi:flagellar biosynthetic protein FliR [Ethanoligenens sp.]|uniref:flagellar biosynthetic protein FliR n=1 Tax=Ethanoligenens sp. TaxID=2099655 RepID=UPI0039E9171D